MKGTCPSPTDFFQGRKKPDIKGGCIQLSHSSANLLRTCQQKFYYYKKDVPIDSDFCENTEALDIGSAFHYVLEHCEFDTKNVASHLKVAAKEFKLGKNVGMVHAMALAYLKFYKTLYHIPVAIEKGIESEFIVGYIDAIEKDVEGNWYIVDLKTSAYITDYLKVRVQRDPQLLIYSHFAKSLATFFGLSMKKFKGCHYRVVSKPKYVQSKQEAYPDFVRRLMASVKIEQIFIPYNPDIIADTISEHKRLEELGTALVADKVKPAKNFNACFDYYKPCQWLSKCYGKEYTDFIAEVQVTSFTTK